MHRIYASLPLSGPAARLGRDVLRGVRLACDGADGVELVVLDSFGEDRDEQAVANARRAVDDAAAVAYVGDFHSSQVLETAPILGDAGLLQVAPVATFAELRGSTLVRLMPHDGVGAQAIADWLVGVGAEELLIVHDHDANYGVAVGAMCDAAAKERGLDVRTRPVWNHDEPWEEDVGDADAVLYVGVAGSGALGLWDDLHRHEPGMWLLGSDGVAMDWLAEGVSSSAAERTRFFVAQRASFDLYGFEAMSLVLDAIAVGGDDRAAVTRAARSTRDRDSILGRYSIDEEGHTTTTAYGRLAIVDGALVWDEPQAG
jgi:branched-chain amino acid transport system substrate-binding protein